MKIKKLSPIIPLCVSVFPVLFLLGGLFLCFQQTGFNIEKISSKNEYNPMWDVAPLSRENADFLSHEIFSQPFYFLASGNICYAFVSDDGRFVIKFFKMQHLINTQRKGVFSRFKKGPDQSLHFERIFESYKDAYDELREETGIFYLHLNKTQDLKMKLSLTDNKGKKYVVDLDRTEYVVQRRAITIYEHIANLARLEKMDEIKRCFKSFFDMVAMRCRKGFASHSLSLRNNFGFCGEKALQIACGSLMRDDAVKYPNNFREEVFQVAERLNNWALLIDPDLCVIIQEEAQRIVNES